MPRAVVASLAFLLLTSCEQAKEECQVLLKSVYPADGSSEGYYRAAIDFELTNPDPTAVITTDIPGEQGVSEDGKHILWLPSADLTPETSYSACLNYCGGESCTAFTTSSAGLPLTDRDALAGNVYGFDLKSGRVTVPVGLGSVLADSLEIAIFLGVDTVSAGAMSMTGTISQTNDVTAQDYCNASVEFETVDFSAEPDVSIASDFFTLTVVGDAIDVEDLLLTGTFSPDGSQLEGVTFHGKVDTRPLAPLVDDGDGSENAICELATSFNTACEVCESDGQTFCLTIEADHITAPLVNGLALVDIPVSNCEGCDTPEFDPATCVE